MNESIYHKLALTFFTFALLCVSLFFIVIFLLLFYQSNDRLFYYAFVAMLGCTLFLGAKIAWDYKVISRFETWKNTYESLVPYDANKCVDVALKYSYGASYDDLKKQYDLNHNMQVQRHIREGIKELKQRCD